MNDSIGLKDIAMALNVSITTVSRALNNKHDISEKTRQLVIEKADELNYRPNVHAVSLRKKQFFALGVILPAIDHYFFSTVLKGIMNKAHMANYLVFVGESTHDLDKEKEIIQQFISHNVTGVIISPSNLSSYRNNIGLLKARRIPCIIVDRPLDKNTEHIVRYDDVNGAFLAVEHLIKQGYKRIAFIKGFDYCVISNARYKGYKKALEQYNIPLREEIVRSIVHIDGTEDGYHLSKRMLLEENKPDAFFAVSDNVASGIYQTAMDLGLSIPDDIGIVGYSNSKISKYLSPTLTTVEQPGIEMGEQAFDFIQQILIKRDSTAQLKKTFEARLVIRKSSIRSVIVS